MAKIRIYQLAKELGMENEELLELLSQMGVPYKSHASTLSEEDAEAVRELVREQRGLQARLAEEERRKSLPRRPPVVVIMGHVDHGKTTLLDYLRKSRIAEKEAGGITQHVGAFEVKTPQGTVVFIDTPGHEAFTSIRQRGARVADIAVIVIAADDGIMPQTDEAIAHAKAAGAKILFALNKMDLPQADPDRVKRQLMERGFVPEEYGGEAIVVPISAKTGMGVQDLLEMILLIAELEDYRADPNAEPRGVVLESRLDKQAGIIANILVQEGTFRVGDYVVAGEVLGRIRAMMDADGQQRKEAGPGSAVQVLGFQELPHAGDVVEWVPDLEAAKEITEERKEERRAKEEAERERRPKTMADLLRALQEEGKKEVNLILRADTQGSLEAIQHILAKESTEEVQINVLLAQVGAPTESDVLLAQTSGAAILAFGVNPAGSVKKAAEQKGVLLKTFRIIYDLIDEVRTMVKGQREPQYKEEVLGRAEVRAIFRLPGGKQVAGCMVTQGKVPRSAEVRVLRKGQEIWKGRIASLKRFKEDVREVAQGYECGIGLEGFDEFQEGDILEAFQMVEIPA
ncbi:MAG: translation initiation factor IF-2 [Thermus sp.]|uniref:translation initiation factor IF-2 n=1 Tax=unclassified Thermus TaxID=2619321 RepID=UPI00023891ED|nr:MULTISPECIES: translation initiation factor IF-2 [unclassified Thermus]AEV16499.1 Translation initiation factor IF-2 [Thermus sp. CCB_US3_UF1]MCS7217601.1 translation initiation factor IF-2 [Thermus sp.]MCX7849407.1 translation initiation factor IF-2 [Thermus sp.]MDW8017647.1 translation initiation factor IF-2 [Thermus sp.]MDW8356937.1 translation initiation factor IF-2 [Thermus sp.]